VAPVITFYVREPYCRLPKHSIPRVPRAPDFGADRAAHRALAERGDETDPTFAFEAALEVRTRDALPVDWAMTRETIALCFEAMAGAFPEEAEAHRAAALAAVEDALPVYDPETMPDWHRKATALRDRLRAGR
jgi:hypothetical protein